LTPNTDGQIIRLVIPSLTEERRMELVKMVNRRAEESKVALRNHRREGLEDLRELEKESIISEDEFYRARDDLQDLTDRYIDRVDEIQKRKEKEITEI
jgi:ribosome recycling factor